jgi:ABC-type Fe3+-citrate transport system substrate-binding protein
MKEFSSETLGYFKNNSNALKQANIEMSDEEKINLQNDHLNLLDNMLSKNEKSQKKPNEQKWATPNAIRETHVSDEENEDFNEP